MGTARLGPILKTLVGLLVACLLTLAVVIALHVWLSQAPILNELGFFDGLLHGTFFPVGSVAYWMGLGGVKDFASGWAYEVGFYLGAAALFTTWQTVLQIRAYRLVGQIHAIERPVLGATAGSYLILLLVGGVFGTSVIAPITEVPALFGLAPGWIRHGLMALFGCVVPLSGGVAAVQLSLGSRGDPS